MIEINQPLLLDDAFRNRFSRKALRVGLNLSAIAYEPKEAAAERLMKLGWHGDFFSSYGVDCYVCTPLLEEMPKVCAIAFRGSEMNRADWMRNANAKKMRSNGSSARDHAGYHKGWLVVARLVVKAIAESKAEKVLFCGHSAGGGLAIAALLDFLTNSTLPPQPLDYALYSYGSPATLNYQAAQLIDLYAGSQVFRVSNQADVVPRSNPGSCHVGELIYTSGNRIYRNPGWWRVGLDRLKARFLTPQIGEGIADHMIVDYAKAIEKNFGLQGTDLQ